MQSIYERIEQLIKNKGMTKKAFGERLNISAGNLGDWRRGKSTPSTHKLIEIAAFFSVSLDWLMTGKEWQPESVKEAGGRYFFDESRQSDCQQSELSDDEKTFIREYLAFAAYRRSLGSRKSDSEESDT
ncbi:helix-turn-helix domain-containing protein [Saccharibacillus alkalitolerans]|uniref:Helix-turn-helix transcriptional regulator n=1 Tax=Saccharibacillus alkalitolerans TaxID=2705290 RepID=A0ABX0F7V9_9BACL|nr:helix-turn-helix transcriptional regulator [Saccharibacillus alkalitolerans]NGZ76020.1 helix-turn-helix transcriptional regulator [Saccharibacillus alkalitolerans]